MRVTGRPRSLIRFMEFEGIPRVDEWIEYDDEGSSSQVISVHWFRDGSVAVVLRIRGLTDEELKTLINGGWKDCGDETIGT